MGKMLKKNERRKKKFIKSIDKLKNKINLKEKKLAKINIKIAGIEKKVAEKKAKKLSLLELTEKTCKWPVGDPATEDFWFCGLATQSGKPYCEAHVGVAFQPMNSRRDRRR